MNSDLSDREHAATIELAQALIRIDTSNPPGNETPAADLLHSWLSMHGVTSELVGDDPRRPGVVARVKGASSSAPTIALCGHIDVVPAGPDGWTSPPFAAEVHDGWLVGRGACDMKSQVASYASVLASLANRSFPPRGDVLLLAVADEECAQEGASMRWLTQARPDLATDFAIDEGGGDIVTHTNGGKALTVSTAEKATTVTRITANVSGGHGSHTEAGNNALSVVARALTALEADTPTDLMIIGDDTRSTLNPTRMHCPAGNENVAPGTASVDLDTRLLPGDTEAEMLARVRARLNHLPVTVDTLYDTPLGGSESPARSPLMDALQDATAKHIPDTILAPMVFPGFTNAHFLRTNWNTTTYGCWPRPRTTHTTFWQGVHAKNERIDIRDITLATDWTLSVVDALRRTT